MQVEEHLGQLAGAQCWTVIGDQHPDVHIGFGGRVRRKKPLSNDTLTDEEREFQPELDILIKCSWRLQSGDTVLAGPVDGGAALELLVGGTVESVEASAPAWDLTLHFSGGLDLMVSADETRDGYDNYSVCVRGTYWTVEASSVTSWERIP